MRRTKYVAALAVLTLAGAALAQSITGELTDQVPKKFHGYKLETGKVYEFQMKSKAFDTFLRIQDGKGKELGTDDDSGEGLNARLVFAPPAAGDYEVVADSFGSKGRGPYELTMRILPEIQPGKTITGKIDDKTLKPGDIRFETYVVKLTAGTPYKIDMKSKAFDSILGLKKAGQPKEEIKDDDSGGGLDAQILYTPKTTDYYELMCGSLDQNEGPFTLSVEVTAKQN